LLAGSFPAVMAQESPKKCKSLKGAQVAEECPKSGIGLPPFDHGEWSLRQGGGAADTPFCSLNTENGGPGRSEAISAPVLEDLGNVPRELTGSSCQRCFWHWRNVSTGELLAGRCRASMCPYCGPFEAWWKARIVSNGGASGPPERFAVLTLAPPAWSSLRQKMKDLRRYARGRGIEWEQAWTVELGSKTGMRHVNVLQKGDFFSQAELQELWGAIVHISALQSVQKATEYALKEARTVTGYALKEAGKGLEEHLSINGWRLVHLSRGYLGGMTQASVRAGMLAQTEEELDQWQRVPGRLK
jgi:hypothetical protein